MAVLTDTVMLTAGITIADIQVGDLDVPLTDVQETKTTDLEKQATYYWLRERTPSSRISGDMLY